MSLGRWCRACLLAVFTLLALAAQSQASSGSRNYLARDRIRPMAALEPPVRPANFNNMDELSHYLEDMKQYYAMLGRPRFGRSVDRLESLRRTSENR